MIDSSRNGIPIVPNARPAVGSRESARPVRMNRPTAMNAPQMPMYAYARIRILPFTGGWLASVGVRLAASRSGFESPEWAGQTARLEDRVRLVHGSAAPLGR